MSRSCSIQKLSEGFAERVRGETWRFAAEGPLVVNSSVFAFGDGSLSAAFGMDHLRAFIMYYISQSPESNTDEGREKAQGHLLAFANICEKEKAYELLTPNLHTADCQLPYQEQFAGSPFQISEMWVERGMNVVSSTACKRTPEATLANRRLLAMAVDESKIHQGMDSDETAVPKYVPKENLGARISYDVVDDGNPRLLGKGTALRQSDLITRRNSHTDKLKGSVDQALIQLIKQYADRCGERYPKDVTVHTHNAAAISTSRGLEEVSSFFSKKEHKRRSYFATVTLRDDDNSSMVCRVAMIYQFVRLSGLKRKREERYAICAVYDSQEDKETGLFVVDEVQGAEVFKYQRVAVPLVDIGPEVACFEVEQSTWKEK